MFSWQKYIEANKDTAKQQADVFNKNLETKYQTAAEKASKVKSDLDTERTRIKDIKDQASAFATSPVGSSNISDEQKRNIANAAQKGYSVDFNKYKEPLANVAKESADIAAANRIAGRMGTQGIATPSQGNLADQILLQQGGAGEGFQDEAQALDRQLAGIGEAQTGTSSEAGALQGQVTDALSGGLKTLEPKAKQSAIALGKDKVGQIQSDYFKNLNWQKELGAMNPTLAQEGSLGKYIKNPTLADEDYLSYGFNDEMGRVNEMRSMLGKDAYGVGGLKDVTPTIDKEAAKKQYEFLKNLQLQAQDKKQLDEATKLTDKIEKGQGTLAPAGFASSTISGKTNKFDENKDYLVGQPTDKEKMKQVNYRFQNLLRGR
jgi:hypothetical protein